jgi:pyruvate-formate lyase-activating enzyme
LKKAGIHTAIETCGSFSENLIDDLSNSVDLFLFDIKHPNPDRHHESTGVSNEKILSNFSEILRRAGTERIIPRIPLIPGFNTDEKSINDMVSFLKQTNYAGAVHLLPYHNWSKGKYHRIGRAGSFRDPGKISEAELNKICGIFNDAGFRVVCYG